MPPRRGFAVDTALLAALMAQRGVSQRGLARGTGLSQSFIRDVLTAKRNASAGSLVAIARELDIGPMTLLADGEPGDLLLLLTESEPCPL